MGGLGNQMFQYAFARSVANRLGTSVYVDTSLLSRVARPASKGVSAARALDLIPIGVQPRMISSVAAQLLCDAPANSIFIKVLRKVLRSTRLSRLVLQEGHSYDESLVRSIRNQSVLVGRWQSESFFSEHADAVRDEYSFRFFTPTADAISISKSFDPDCSIAIQTRRTDYVTEPRYAEAIGALSRDYVFDALALARRRLGTSKLNVFVGGDDVEWCRRVFGSEPGVTILSSEHTQRGFVSHLWLLTHFKHHVICNGTFSWWGAWLGEKPGSCIVAPETWGRTSEATPERILPDRWLTVPNDFEPIAF